MHSRFDIFRATPLGTQIEALLDAPDRYLEYAALSRAGVPAVAAVVHDLLARFPEVTDDQTARQFCGAVVAEVMRRRHHEILRPRGRVPGDLLTYGAVWTPQPRRKTLADLVATLGRMPEEVERLFATVAPADQRTGPAGTGFSAVEHLCHLRDLDQVYQERVERILTLDLPHLASFNGTAVAEERNYLAQDPGEALSAFRLTRDALIARLADLSPVALGRIGLRDGIRRMTLLEIVEEIHDHDRTHVQELHELLAELNEGRVQ